MIASAGGARRHPAWYLNLRTNPRVGAQRGDSVQTMIARTAVGAERARLWVRVIEQLPACVAYQQETARALPIVVLRPARPASSARRCPAVRARALAAGGRSEMRAPLGAGGTISSNPVRRHEAERREIDD